MENQEITNATVETTVETTVEPTVQTFTQADLDRARTEASQTARKNAEKELRESIRKELEKEAQMTAEERAKLSFENELKQLKEEKLELNRDRAKSILKEAGLNIDASTDLINSVVSDDKEKTIQLATLLATQFKTSLEELRKNDREAKIKSTETPKVSETKAKQWADMTYQERIDLKEKNPTLYAENVKKHSKNY